jgi:deoxyadenosine/deoxycytidine kinase
MIVVIEGPSAVGKTTWCRTHVPVGFIEDSHENIDAPSSLRSDPEVASAFWTNFEIQRWKAALQMEREKGIAVCDSDPLHLYYAWALWKSGALASALFEASLNLYRTAIREKQLGFADIVIWIDADVAELRKRKSGDHSRGRKQHEINLACLPWMKIWFAARERFLPGTVHLGSKELVLKDLAAIPALSVRYASETFDLMIQDLQLA